MILVYGRNQRGENWNVVISLRHIILQLYAYLYQKCKFIRRILPFLALKAAIFADHAFANFADFVDALDMIILRPLFGSGPHLLLWIVL